MMPCVQARPGIAPECAPFKRQRVQCSRASLKRMLMHEETLWFLIVGAVLDFMGIAATTLRRLPRSAAMFYLAIGYALWPPGIELLRLDIAADAHLLRTITEIALLVSLFAIGLRLRLGVLEKLWTVPLRLGFLAMLATI